MSKRRVKRERVARTSPDVVAEQIERLREVFPEAAAEGKVDWEKLRATLGEIVDEQPERYSFTWTGKQEAIRVIQTPSRAALIPCPKESVNWESTQHVFIEGENLEVLKLLYKAYFGRVKMIYIDPPYNTGNDFVYRDNYADPLDAYLQLTGQRDVEGNLLTSNPQTSGRYHSAWLSMVYPRLFLARQLLREDGVIFVSIDDNEVHNLRMLMNGVFGEENCIAELVWEKGRKNDAKLFSVGHEYMLVYARSKATLKEQGTVWREAKPGAKEIWEEYQRLRQTHGTDDDAIEKALRRWYSSLPDSHPSKALRRYKQVDAYGPWRDHDISWPSEGGPRYDVMHPTTKKPCRVPDNGWRFADPATMKRQIDLGLVVFREDHTQPPYRKAHLRPVPDELEDEKGITYDPNGADLDDVGLQVMPSVLYKQAQVAVKYLRELMGGLVFDNPKDHEILARLARYVTSDGGRDIVLDFFAGCGSTAEAVLQLNHDTGDRRFVMVQLPEPTPEDSVAREMGYPNVAEIGKERVRRVLGRLREAKGGQQSLEQRKTPEDLGFRVYKLTESSFRQWSPPEGDEPEAMARHVELFEDPLTDGWTRENVIAEVALKEAGFGLNYQASRIESITTNIVWEVRDPDREQRFLICLDETIKNETIRALDLTREELFICRDRALDDTLAANLATQCRLKVL